MGGPVPRWPPPCQPCFLKGHCEGSGKRYGRRWLWGRGGSRRCRATGSRVTPPIPSFCTPVVGGSLLRPRLCAGLSVAPCVPRVAVVAVGRRPVEGIPWVHRQGVERRLGWRTCRHPAASSRTASTPSFSTPHLIATFYPSTPIPPLRLIAIVTFITSQHQHASIQAHGAVLFLSWTPPALIPTACPLPHPAAPQ